MIFTKVTDFYWKLDVSVLDMTVFYTNKAFMCT